jgi:hypothetical protein
MRRVCTWCVVRAHTADTFVQTHADMVIVWYSLKPKGACVLAILVLIE